MEGDDKPAGSEPNPQPQLAAVPTKAKQGEEEKPTANERAPRRRRKQSSPRRAPAGLEIPGFITVSSPPEPAKNQETSGDKDKQAEEEPKKTPMAAPKRRLEARRSSAPCSSSSSDECKHRMDLRPNRAPRGGYTVGQNSSSPSSSSTEADSRRTRSRRESTVRPSLRARASGSSGSGGSMRKGVSKTAMSKKARNDSRGHGMSCSSYQRRGQKSNSSSSSSEEQDAKRARSEGVKIQSDPSERTRIPTNIRDPGR